MAAALVGSLAEAQTTTRASVSTSGAQGTAGSGNASISADGRFVAFDSSALDLVAGDTNWSSDVFLHDGQLGTTECVSVDSAGVQGNSYSYDPSLSADGRFVAFHSLATNLVAGDTNGFDDIFVRDLQSGVTELVSVSSVGVQGNSWSLKPSLSADGRFVAFYSLGSNLVANDTNACGDVFVHDLQSATTERVSVSSAGSQGNSETGGYPSLSADGRFVAFHSSASNLVTGDTNLRSDVFVRDRQSATTECASVDSAGVQGDSDSERPSLSADGRLVAFQSLATNLVIGDTNAYSDVLVHDRQSGATALASVDSGGAQADSGSYDPSISADGRFVAFWSNASNLVAGDTNACEDVLVRDRGSSYPPSPFCLGDGSAGACPCGNNGAPGRGCENSASTGGAVLTATGNPSLSSDTLVLSSSGELPQALSIFLQGTTTVAPLSFGDGLRCTAGLLKRLYILNASAGFVSVPEAGDPSISARSAALGDLITSGSTRYYQTYYRDPVLDFCAVPPGNNWNISSGLAADWGQ